MGGLNQGRIIRLDDFGQTFEVSSCYASGRTQSNSVSLEIRLEQRTTKGSSSGRILVSCASLCT